MFDAVVGFMLVVMINTLEYCEPYNCYELLNVSSSASVQQIKKAYREMAMQYHPDRVQGN